MKKSLKGSIEPKKSWVDLLAENNPLLNRENQLLLELILKEEKQFLIKRKLLKKLINFKMLKKEYPWELLINNNN